MQSRNRRTAYAVTAAVAAIAAANSYSHIYSLARTHGQSALGAALTPLSVDGPILAASVALLRSTGRSKGRSTVARAVLVLFVGATLLANALYGMRYGAIGAAISACPSVAFLACCEIAMRMADESAPARAVVRRGAPKAGVNPPKPTVADKAPAAPERSLHLVFADEIAGGVKISKRMVKERCHVSWDNAVRLHAQLPAAVAA